MNDSQDKPVSAADTSTGHLNIFLAYLFLAVVYFYKPVFQGRLISTADSEIYYYPVKVYYSKLIENGFPLWLPYEFLGLSFFSSIQQGSLYPLNFIFFAMPTPYAFNFLLILHFAMAAFFTFLYLRLLGLKALPSFLGGFVFGFSGLFMAHRHYVEMQHASAWIPALFYLYERIKTGPELRYVVLAVLSVAFQILAGHPQICVMTYLFLGMSVLFSSYYVVRERRFFYLVRASLPILIGFLIAFPQLVAVQEWASLSQRAEPDYNFMVGGSFAPFMLPVLVFPFIFGGGYGYPYWGAWDHWHIVEQAAFTGVLPVVLATIVFFRQRSEDANVRFWGVVCLISLFLSFGMYNPFYKIVFYIPVLNLFRMPSRYLLFFNLGVAILFAFAVNYLLSQQENRKVFLRTAVKGVFITGVVGAIYFWFGNSMAHSYHPEVLKGNLLTPEARRFLSGFFSISNPVLIVPLFFVFSYGLWLYAYSMITAYQKIFLGLLAALVFAEAYSFGTFFDNDWPKIRQIKANYENPAFRFLESNAKWDRSVFLSSGSHPLWHVSRKIHALNGYDSLRPRNLYEIIGNPVDTEIPWVNLIKNNTILSMFNVKYLVAFPWTHINEEEIVKSAVPVMRKDEPVKRFPVILRDWELINAKPLDSGAFILRSPDGKRVSLMQQTVSLSPNSNYILSVMLRGETSKEIHVAYDLYAPAYDSDEQELDITILPDDGELKRYSLTINTGPHIPSSVYLRLFTFSREPVEVQDTMIEEILFPKVSYPYVKVFEEQGFAIYENKRVLERAFAVQELRSAQSTNDIKNHLYDIEFNPLETAFVNREDFEEIGRNEFSLGAVTIKSYEPDQIEINASFSGEGFVVLSDQDYPGWKAFVDGQETKIYRVNGLLRGIVVPEGQHGIQFRYVPTAIFKAMVVGGLFLMGCITYLTYDYVRIIRRAHL